MLVDGFLQAFEDISRHKADKEANSSIAFRYVVNPVKGPIFEECHWRDLQVGDFIRIGTRQLIPADVV